MANRYWVGGTGTWNTSSNTNWSASTGGSSGASVPGTGDAVVFDQAATYTVTMTGALNCLDITVSAGTVTFATGTSPTLTVYGNMSLVAATVWNSTGNVTFNATTTGKTITTNAVTLTPNVLFNGSGGAWTLGSALTLGLTSTANLANGTLDLGGFTFTTGIFNSTVSTTRALSFSSAGNIALAHTTAAQTVLSLQAPNLTVTGTGGFTSVMSVTRRFNSLTGPYTGAQPNLTLSSGSANFTIDANSYFNVLNFGTCTGNILSANPVYMGTLALSSGGTFTSLLATMRDTGNITTNGKSIGTLTINSAGTTTFLGNVSATTYTQTAGNVDFATYSLTASGNVNFASGILSNAGNISGANWSVTGNLAITSGNVISTAFIFNSAASTLNINGGTLTANSSFTHTAGTVTLGTNANFSSTSTYNFTAGTITLANNTLTVGAFSTSGSNARTITFGTGNIALTATIANTTVLTASAVSNLTCTGTGGFTSIMSTTRTFTGGSSLSSAQTNENLYNLFITSGTSNVTFTNNSYYKSIDFSGSNCALAVAAGVQTQSLTLSSSSGANFTLLSVTMRGNGTIRGNTKSLANLTTNQVISGNTTLADAVTCANFIMTAGNVDFANFSMTATANANYTAGNMSNIGSISCGNYFLSTGSLTFTQGNLNVTTNLELSNGTSSFTYSGGNLNITGNLVQYSTGNFNLTQAMTLPSTCTYNIQGGNLNLNNNILTTGRFTSTGTANARNINFGTANIVLNGTGTVLSWSGSNTNTYTGTGTFTTDATVARTFSATTSNYSMGVSLVFTGNGSVAPAAFTTAVYKSIDFGNVAFATPSGSISAETIVLSPGANYNATSRFETYGTGTFNSNGNPTVRTIYFGNSSATLPAGTTTLISNLSVNGSAYLSSGNLDCNNFTIICANNGVFTYTATDGGKFLNVSNFTMGRLAVGNSSNSNCTLELDSGNIITESLQAYYNGTINYRTGANLPVVANLMLGRSIGGFLSGNVTLYKDLTMANTGSNGYTLGVSIYGGTLNLNGYTLTTTVITDSAETGTGNTLIRGLNFGSGGNIILPYDNRCGMSLGGFSAANFTLSGTGNVTAIASAASSWFANSANLAFNLTLTGSGNATNNCTIYSNSYFDNLDISNVTSVVSNLGNTTTVFVKTASLPTSANTINVFVATYDTGTITSGGATLGRLNIAPPSGTTTLLSNITINTGGVVYLNTGNLNLNNFNITTSQLISTALANNRGINFGSGNIIINNGTGTGLAIANAINFTSTGTGGFVYTGTTARTWSFGNTASGLSNNAPSLKFIGASMANQSVSTNSWFNVLDFGNTAMSLNANAAVTLNLNGLILSSGGTFSNLTANIVGTGSINGNSKTIPQLIINHSGNTTFTGSLTTTSNVTLTSGNVNLGGYTLTPNEFISGTSATRNITGPGTVAVANNWTVTDGTGFTGSNYTINMSKATAKTFTGANGTYGTLVQAGAGNLTIAGSNQFDNITANTRPSTITFTAGTTQTVLSFTASGNAGNVVTLNSTSAGTIYYLRNYVGTGNSSYLTISDSNASAAFFANTNSTNSGNNTGWNFAAPSTVQSGFNAFF